MFKKMKHMKNEKGLTLIELLAVIVILAIIAAIAIPAIGNIIDNSRVKAAKSDAANIVSAANIYFTENSSATTFTNGTTPTTGWQNYVTDLGSITTFTVTKGNATSPATINATGSTGGKNYKIEGATAGTGVTIKALKVDKGDETDDGFAYTS